MHTESNEGSVTVKNKRSNPSLQELNVVSVSNLENVEIEEVSPGMMQRRLNHDSANDLVNYQTSSGLDLISEKALMRLMMNYDFDFTQINKTFSNLSKSQVMSALRKKKQKKQS